MINSLSRSRKSQRFSRFSFSGAVLSSSQQHSGTKDERAERKKLLALAQARNIDTILVTELTRWGRSMLDLFHTLQDLQAWGVSLVAQTGLQFDLRTAQGKLIASLMAAARGV